MLNKQICHLCFWNAAMSLTSSPTEDKDKVFNVFHEQLNKLFLNLWNENCFCLCCQNEGSDKLKYKEVPVPTSSWGTTPRRFWLRPVGSAPFQECLYVTEQQVEQKTIGAESTKDVL